MKKLLLLVMLALSTLTVSAQEDSKFTFEIGAGLSKVVGSDANTKMNFSYMIGATYDFALSENFYIVPGLELINKGFKSDVLDGAVNMYYIQVPILATYKFNIADNIKLAIKAGPYAAFGAFGNDIKFTNGKKINVFDSDGGYKRFDAGLKAGVAVEISQFSIGAEYSRGFLKLDSDYKQYTQVFGLVFGYKF
jgi:hypothetical protein